MTSHEVSFGRHLDPFVGCSTWRSRFRLRGFQGAPGARISGSDDQTQPLWSQEVDWKPKIQSRTDNQLFELSNASERKPGLDFGRSIIGNYP